LPSRRLFYKTTHAAITRHYLRRYRNEIMPTLYHRDESLPFWKNNVAIESILEDFESNGTIPGHFEGGILGDHCFSWTFTPNRDCEPALVFPVYEHGRLLDILAIASHDHRIFGCVTGFGQYVGTFSSQLRVHKNPDSWLKSGTGILPLAKAFFPLMRLADSIIADDADHAEKIANEAFIYPAERFGLDCFAAERAALEKISIA
jgi:hypothetical protein